jgi:Zn-dependent protease
MLRSWKIGKAFGIEVYIHWSVVLLLAGVLFLGRLYGDESVILSLAAMVFLYGCVLLHEFGHALTGIYYGIKTRDITLYPIGGVARMERMSEKPIEEFCIAVAGPAVNVLIAGALLGISVATGYFSIISRALGVMLMSMFRRGDAEMVLRQLSPEMQLWIYVIFLNIMLVVFNMIPAFPMDGGRVLRALLSGVIGHRPATEAAATIGMVLSAAMVLSGLKVVSLPLPGNGSPMLLLVGMFVFFAGQQELYMVRYRDAQRQAAGMTGPNPMPAPFIRPSPLAPEPNFSGFTWDRQHHVWIEWRNGRPIQASWVPSE